MKRLALVALAGLGLGACTIDATDDVALVPAAPVVVERQTVVPSTPLGSTTTVIQREQGTRIIR